MSQVVCYLSYEGGIFVHKEESIVPPVCKVVDERGEEEQREKRCVSLSVQSILVHGKVLSQKGDYPDCVVSIEVRKTHVGDKDDQDNV